MDTDPIYDHSTLEGRTQRVLKCCSNNWIWAFLPGVALLLVAALLLANSDFTPGSSVPGSPVTLQAGSLVFRPTGPPGVLKDENSVYNNIQTQKLNLKKLDLESIIIDAPLFSERLQNSLTLESIRLEHVGVSGNFSRVYLPALKQFSLTQIRNAPTDTYKTKESLQSALFFDLDKNRTWDLNKDVLNLGVDIRVGVGGTTLLRVARAEGLININLKHCEEIYRNLGAGGPPVTSMTLSWCPVTNSTLLPLSHLTYLNLNNAVPDEVILAEVLRGATQLQEFHAFLPTDDALFITLSPDEKKRRSVIQQIPVTTSINLTDTPTSLRTLSLSRLGISDPGPNYISNIENLTLEMVDVSVVLPKFNIHFPNLKKVAVLNATSIDQGYEILSQILKSNASWILLLDFGRNPSGNFSSVEAFLGQLGISPEDEDFLIERDVLDGAFRGESVTPFNKHFYRYNLLAFTDVETFDDYMYWDAVFRRGHKHLRAWANMPTGT